MRTTSESITYLLSETNSPKEIFNFIDGKFQSGSDVHRQSILSENPAIGRPWLQLPASDVSHVNKAVEAASGAFESWSCTSREHRAALLNKVAAIVEANLEGIAQLESRDQGKTIKMAREIEIPRCAHNFRIFASAIVTHTNASLIQEVPIKALNYVKTDPIGVAALISPWNLPLYLLSFKLAPALACGNTVVCKPSEMTSATAWVLFHAFAEAGFPPGVVNLILGTGPEAGEPLVAHPKTSVISFTGSTSVGKYIAGIAAQRLKKVSLELGGKNPAIVFPSVDLDEIIPTLIRSCFANQGEICLCTSRLFVHEEIFSQFLNKFVTAAKKLKVGDPTDPNTDVGALISKAHFHKVNGYITMARQQGLEVLCGGPINAAQGYFIAPTVITGTIMDDNSRLMHEEIFGPVVCVVSFQDTQEVIRRANSVPYGLSASVWSKNVDELTTVSNKLRVGTVWCNCWLVRELNMPFGGTKQSGIGREGIVDSLHFFTEQKNVCLRMNE